jgi:hypothetical protein
MLPSTPPSPLSPPRSTNMLQRKKMEYSSTAPSSTQFRVYAACPIVAYGRAARRAGRHSSSSAAQAGSQHAGMQQARRRPAPRHAAYAVPRHCLQVFVARVPAAGQICHPSLFIGRI